MWGIELLSPIDIRKNIFKQMPDTLFLLLRALIIVSANRIIANFVKKDVLQSRFAICSKASLRILWKIAEIRSPILRCNLLPRNFQEIENARKARIFLSQIQAKRKN